MCLRMDPIYSSGLLWAITIKRTWGTPCYMAGFENELFWVINTEIANFQIVRFKEYVEKGLTLKVPWTYFELLLMIQESLTRQRTWILSDLITKYKEKKSRGDCPKDPDNPLETRFSLIALENKVAAARASELPLGKPILLHQIGKEQLKII